MNRRAALAVAVLASVLSAARAAAAPAGGAAPQRPDAKAMVERNARCMRGLSAQAAQVSFDRGDVERFLAEWRSFDALDIEDGSEDGSDGPGCLDLAAAVKDPRYVAWARARRLDPKDWLLKSMRISLTHAKRRAPQQAAELKAQLETQRRELAQRCKSMGPDACRDMDRAFADADTVLRETSAMVALFPTPTRAEAALLDEYDARLREATEGPRHRRHGEGELDAPAGADPGDSQAEGDDPPAGR